MQELIVQHRQNLALRLETLTRIRWFAVIGQIIAIFFVHFQLGFEFLVLPCLAIVGASIWLNIFLRFRYPGNVRWRGRAITALLAYDILQLSVLLYLTGGIQNPFAVLIAVPVVVSAAAQKFSQSVPLFLLAVLVSGILVFYYQPLPWYENQTMIFPLELRIGIWVAIVSTMGFTAIYMYRVANETRKLADALAATEIVLQREQHISNLDGLAAAAAHELGTPLATISLVSKEILLSSEENTSLHDDASLLKSQADRCREILRKISTLSSEGDENIVSFSVRVLMEEVCEPYRGGETELQLELHGSGPIPITKRNPAILYGLGNLVENAFDFAKSAVRFTCEWTEQSVEFTIRDDGGGFPAGILERIGEPYISVRTGGNRVSGGGLGLGLFIAKTLLERNGATLKFDNYEIENVSGAQVVVNWKREDFEIVSG